MNFKRISLVMGLGWGAIGLSAHAALLNLGQYQTGPYYSDFTANNLDVNYVYTGNSSSGTGVFKVSDSYSSGALNTAGDTYTSGADAPGSHGSFKNAPFTGSYSLTADISWNGSVATLTSGNFDISGTLMGGTASSVLLTGSLKTGAGSSAFGFVDHTATMTTGEYNEFDFLVNLGSLSGNTELLQDFLQSMGGTGGIRINANFDYTGHLSSSKTVYNVNNGSTTTTINEIPPPTTYGGFQGYWDQSFANPLNAGTADTFVPEPKAYPWGASIAALTACACCARRTWPFARRQLNGVKHD